MNGCDDTVERTAVAIPADEVVLQADLATPREARGIVLFAHGSGSSRRSIRNRYVADVLTEQSLSTLLADLLTVSEERADQITAQWRFDIDLLARRLIAIADWIANLPEFSDQPLGLFGASTGAAAALIAAAERPHHIKAVVSRGGRPDLANRMLSLVRAPTLLIVGGHDTTVLAMNRDAQALMRKCETQLEIVPGATHLFEEPGALEQVASLATNWFTTHLAQTHLT